MSDEKTDDTPQWPDCATEGCDGKIYLQPGKRKYCRKCELADLAPLTELPPLPEPYAAK